MTIRLHAAIAATVLGATVAVGGASLLPSLTAGQGAKTDRLPVAAPACRTADASSDLACPAFGPRFVTVETRGEGVSVLTRVPAAAAR